VLAVSGVAASLKYVDSAAALYGTSYGVMLGAKACLFAALLLLGAVNNMGIRKLASVKLAPRLKRCVEAEIVIGITAFLAAASLTSQPPAIDLKTDRVSLSAIYQRSRPTWPRLKTPDLKDISPATRHAFEKTAIADATLLQSDIAHPNTASDIAWSEYNHNWVGLMLLVMGMFAFLSRTGRVPIARHWPLIFLALAIFIFIRADPENWPLGPNGFWESFDQIEVVQHRAAALMVVAFAVFEWRVQGNKTRSAVVPLVFPAVCVVGGALLLTHTHALANSKDQVLAELSHTPLAILAVFAGSMRWLELRLPRPDTKIPGRIWPVCFMLIGVLLLTYKER
jgi:putative copper resistance protein D